MSPPDQGHLFVTRGDLTGLACDAILVPSGTLNGRLGDVAEHWGALGLPRDDDGFVTPAPDHSRRAVQVVPGGGDHPAVWLGLTGNTGNEPAEWYAEAIVGFIRQAAESWREQTGSSSGQPLLAVPLAGTGKGGGK